MKLQVLGMMCGHCVKRVENALKQVGATNLKVEIGNVEFDGIDESVAKEAIEDLGFEIKEAIYPKKIAAAIPPAAALVPPIKAPMKPY